MEASSSGDRNDGKSDNSDDLSAFCGYKDVNQFSQVKKLSLQFNRDSCYIPCVDRCVSVVCLMRLHVTRFSG